MKLKCSLCRDKKVMLESGVLVCRICDAAMPYKGQTPPTPTWWVKVGMEPPPDPFKE